MAIGRRAVTSGAAFFTASAVLASTAFACTGYRGKLTASGGSNTSGTTSETIAGGGSGEHAKCGTPTTDWSAAHVAPTGAGVTVHLALTATTANGSCTANQFPADQVNVMMAGDGSNDCMNDAGWIANGAVPLAPADLSSVTPPAVAPSQRPVTSGGAWSGDFYLAPSYARSPGSYNICVNDVSANPVINMVKITLT